MTRSMKPIILLLKQRQMICESTPLVDYDDFQGYHLPNRAEEILKAFGDQDFVVVGAIGKPKTGKSYVLNHILSNPQAFQVHSQVLTSTRGIQMSTRLADIDGKKVLVLDNESFGSESKVAHDSRLFFLNMVLSSVVIYNNFGVIDEHALTNLSLIINLGQKCHSVTSKDWSVQKPCLLWLVRDFILKLQTTKGEPCTAKEYLEKILDQQKGLTSSISQKNNVRGLIKQVFQKRDCETLVRPAKEERDLHKLSSIPFTDLRKQFTEDIRRMKDKLSQCMKPKKINGQPITGPLVVKLVKAYLESFNKSTPTPSIGDIWSMIQAEQRREVNSQIEEIYLEVYSEFKTGRITDLEEAWNSKAGRIITHKDPEIVRLIKDRKEQHLQKLYESRDTIIPITFDEINLDYLQSAVIKNFGSQESTEVKNYNKTKALETELASTKKELSGYQQKCQRFEKEREVVVRTIQHDKYSETMVSRKRDEITSSKYDEESASVVSKLLEMYQKLEEKHERQSEINRNTFSYICSHCKIEFEPAEFQSHLEKLKNREPDSLSKSIVKSRGDRVESTVTESNYQPKASFFTPYMVIPEGLLRVDIQKTLIKEDQQHRNYIEYIIKVSLRNSKWVINRKYKDFCELHDILLIMLPELDFPDSSALIKIGMLANVTNNVNKKNIVEERRKTLQSYLTEIIDLDEVRNTRILQKFLKINQEYKELDYLEDQSKPRSKSPLGKGFKENRLSIPRLDSTNSTYSNSQVRKYAESKYKNAQK